MPQTITSGISPKVSTPAVALAVFGLLAAIAGILLNTEALTTVGLTTIAAAVAGGFIGYQAPAGTVLDTSPVEDPGTPSDDLLPAEAIEQMPRETPEA